MTEKFANWFEAIQFGVMLFLTMAVITLAIVAWNRQIPPLWFADKVDEISLEVGDLQDEVMQIRKLEVVSLQDEITALKAEVDRLKQIIDGRAP